MTALLEKLAANDLALGERGKGRACWMAFGYLLAQGNIEYIALHDADVLDYDRAMLARLLYPVADPILNFDFCKGFYARFTDRLNGRVARLFVGPAPRVAQGAPRAPPLHRVPLSPSAIRSPASSPSRPTSRASSASRPTGGSRSASSRRSSGTAPGAGSARSTSPTGTTTSTRPSLRRTPRPG